MKKTFAKLSTVLMALLLVVALCFSLAACGEKKCTHVDKNDDDKCDNCKASFSDGCDAEHRDENDDGQCDAGGEDFTDGCDAEHVDSNDDGKCDKGGEDFTDGCDIHTDGDDEGFVCDTEGCDEIVEPDCEHVDADDDDECDECGFPFEDGCDNHTDGDDEGFVCDTEGCDEVVEPDCEHVDANDNKECDKCGFPFEDGTDVVVPEPSDKPAVEDFSGEATTTDKELSYDDNGTPITGTAPEITIGSVTVTYGGATNQAGSTVAIVEDGENKYLKITSPKRVHDKDRSHQLVVTAEKFVDFEDATSYVLDFDIKPVSTGTLETIWRNEDGEYVQINFNLGSDGYYAFEDTKIAKAGDWSNVRMEFYPSEQAIFVYVDDVYTGKLGGNTYEELASSAIVSFDICAMNSGANAEVWFDDVSLYYSDAEFVEPTPPCKHRDLNDDSECDECGEPFDDGVEEEGPVFEDFEGAYDAIEVTWECTHSAFAAGVTEGKWTNPQKVTNLDFGGYIKVEHPGSSLQPNYSNVHGAYAAVIEEDGNKFVKVVSPDRICDRDRQHGFTAVTSYVFEDANAYVFEADFRLHTTLPDGSAAGTNFSFIIYNDTGKNHIQMTASTDESGLLTMGNCPIAYVNEWFTLRIEFNCDDGSIKFYCKNGNVWEYRGAYEKQGTDTVSDGLFNDIGATIRDIQVSIGGKSQFDVDDVVLYGDCKEFIPDEEVIGPTAPECEHRDADDNLECDKCGEAYEDGKDVEDPVDPNPPVVEPEVNYTIYDFNDIETFTNILIPETDGGDGKTTLNPELYGDAFKMVRSLNGSSQWLKDNTWGVVELEEGGGDNALWISGVEGGQTNGGNRHAHFDLAYEEIAEVPDRWVWGANLYFDTFTSAEDTFEVLFNLAGGGWLSTPLAPAEIPYFAFGATEDDDGDAAVYLGGASDEIIAKVGEGFHIAVEYIPATGEVKTYVNGALLDTEETTSDLTISNIRLEVPSSGRVSLILDNMFFVYADETFKVPAQGGSTEPEVPACEHIDKNDDKQCDNCSEAYEDGCDAEHKDANDDGKCDVGGEAFTDGCDIHRDANDDNKCDFGGEDYTDVAEKLPDGITAEGFEGEGTVADKNLSYGSGDTLVTGTVTEITFGSTVINYGGSTNVHGATASIEEADGNKYAKIVAPNRVHDKDRSHSATTTAVIPEGDVVRYVYQADLLLDSASTNKKFLSVIIYNTGDPAQNFSYSSKAYIQFTTTADADFVYIDGVKAAEWDKWSTLRIELYPATEDAVAHIDIYLNGVKTGTLETVSGGNFANLFNFPLDTTDISGSNSTSTNFTFGIDNTVFYADVAPETPEEGEPDVDDPVVDEFAGYDFNDGQIPENVGIYTEGAAGSELTVKDGALSIVGSHDVGFVSVGEGENFDVTLEFTVASIGTTAAGVFGEFCFYDEENLTRNGMRFAILEDGKIAFRNNGTDGYELEIFEVGETVQVRFYEQGDRMYLEVNGTNLGARGMDPNYLNVTTTVIVLNDAFDGEIIVDNVLPENK